MAPACASSLSLEVQHLLCSSEGACIPRSSHPSVDQERTLGRFRWRHWVTRCGCYTGAEGPSDLIQAGFNHGAPRWGSGRQHSGTGGCVTRMLQRNISSCPGGRVFSCYLQKGAGFSLIPELLCFSHLSVTASSVKGRSPWGGFSPLAGGGVQGVSDPSWLSPQLCVLHQPIVVAATVQVSPLQHSPSW